MLKIIREDITKFEALVDEASHLNACARSCLNPTVRLNSIKEITILCAANHNKVMVNYNTLKDVVEPLIADLALDFDGDDNNDGNSDELSDLDETKMFAPQPTSKSKGKALPKKRVREQHVACSSSTAPIVTEPPVKKKDKKTAKTAEPVTRGRIRATSSKASINDDDTSPGELKPENDDDDKTLTEIAKADREEAAMKKLFPMGIPDNLPHVEDCRFKGAKRIVMITPDDDNTIRYDLKDGSVFWKDALIM